MDTRLIKANIATALMGLTRARRELMVGTGKEVMSGLEATLAAIETARNMCLTASVKANDISTKQMDKKPTLRLVLGGRPARLGEHAFRTCSTKPAIPSVMPKASEQEDIQP
jgi:hypothetical protein